MKKYFADMQYQNQPKNKAEADVQNFARDLNGTLIHGEENLQRFVEQFKLRVAEINLHYPRCKNISTNFRSYNDHNSMWVSADDVTRIDFKAVKHEFPEAGTDTITASSGYIRNPTTIDEFANNAKFQFTNIDGFLGINDYESALIKARCMVNDLENLLVLKLGLPH